MNKALKLGGTLLAAGTAFAAGYLARNKSAGNDAKDKRKESAEFNRLAVYYDMLTKWLENDRDGCRFADYLREQGIRSVGIYGHGKIGILLYQVLKEQDYPVDFFTDTLTLEEFEGIDGVPNLPPEEIKEDQVDAIIITPCFDTHAIAAGLRKLPYNGEIIPLNEMLYDM